jgi:hypothetical protein
MELEVLLVHLRSLPPALIRRLEGCEAQFRACSMTSQWRRMGKA